MSQPEAGHLHNPTTRFSDRASDYAKHRPSYPAPAIDAILHGLGDPASLLAADIGAGTGISARLLADRGARVTAIEPNEAMRCAAEPHPRVEFQGGTAEATELAPDSIHVIVCAQAFHWFRPEPALAEFARVLRPRGRIALMWNDRDDRDPATKAYGDSFRRTSEFPASLLDAQGQEFLASSPLFTGYREATFAYEQRHDEAGLIGRAMSASYAPKDGARHEELLRLLRAIVREFAAADGRITLRYVTRVFLAERA